jgi:hypothetical protein
MVTNACNLSTLIAEAGGLLSFRSFGLQSESLSLKKKKEGEKKKKKKKKKKKANTCRMIQFTY